MIPTLRVTDSKSYNTVVKAFNKELQDRADSVVDLVESAKNSSSKVYLKVNRLGQRIDALEVYVNDLDVVISQVE